eukprot:3672940-Alexandrium_andersonii.AAC.1
MGVVPSCPRLLALESRQWGAPSPSTCVGRPTASLRYPMPARGMCWMPPLPRLPVWSVVVRSSGGG